MKKNRWSNDTGISKAVVSHLLYSTVRSFKKNCKLIMSGWSHQMGGKRSESFIVNPPSVD